MPKRQLLNSDKCPNCGSNDIDYTDEDHLGDKIIKYGNCFDCDQQWEAKFVIDSIDIIEGET